MISASAGPIPASQQPKILFDDRKLFCLYWTISYLLTFHKMLFKMFEMMKQVHILQLTTLLGLGLEEGWPFQAPIIYPFHWQSKLRAQETMSSYTNHRNNPEE